MSDLEKILRFYADPKHYVRKTQPKLDETWAIGINVSRVELDGGGKAKTFLKSVVKL